MRRPDSSVCLPPCVLAKTENFTDAAALHATTEVKVALEAGQVVWTHILPVCPSSHLPARPSLSMATLGDER